MNSLRIFKNEEFGEIRTTNIDGNFWFVAKDISDSLGYSETNTMTKRLDREDFISAKLEGMNMNSTLINESGLYTAILGSKLPTSRKFKRWVTSDVLPDIRKHGAYLTPQIIEEALLNPDIIIQLATNLKKERGLRKLLEKTVEIQEPKVLFADSVSASTTSILIGELAKILKQNGVDIGQNRLFEWLRVNGYLINRNGTDRNIPTQYSMERGLFEIKETSITHSDGHITVSKTSKVTGKGQIYFVNRFLSKVAI